MDYEGCQFEACRVLIRRAKPANKSTGDLPAREEAATMSVSRGLELKDITDEGLGKIFCILAMDPPRVQTEPWRTRKQPETTASVGRPE